MQRRGCGGLNWKQRRELEWERLPIRLLLLALCYLGGIFVGQVLAGQVPSAAGEELAQYLGDFLRLEREPSVKEVLSAAVLYFRYPLAAALLGFASVGVVMLPCLTGLFGCMLSFSVCCFTAAFGGEGVLLALAVFGLRCAVTLPCYFLLAVPSWETSAALAALSFGRGRRSAPVRYGRGWWLRLGAVAAVLLAGMCAELTLSPWLVRLLLGQMTLL